MYTQLVNGRNFSRPPNLSQNLAVDPVENNVSFNLSFSTGAWPGKDMVHQLLVFGKVVNLLCVYQL